MMPTQNIIPVGLQQEIDQRIVAANGNIPSVRQELQKELHALEAQQGNSDGSPTAEVEIALTLAEIRYLDSLTSTAHEDMPKPSFWQRFGSMFAHKDA